MSIPFLLDENPLLYRSARPGERAVGARSVRHGAAPSNSERAAAKDHVLHFRLLYTWWSLIVAQIYDNATAINVTQLFQWVEISPSSRPFGGAYPHLVQDI